MENQKIELRDIESGYWKYILYESLDKDLYIDVLYNKDLYTGIIYNPLNFSDAKYNPLNFADDWMLIKLNEEEKENYINDNKFVEEFAENISHNFTNYLPRSLNHNNFNFINKKTPEK